LSGAIATLTLHAKDAFGNDLHGGRPQRRVQRDRRDEHRDDRPTVDHGDGTYSAPFTGVLAGTASTIGATIDALP